MFRKLAVIDIDLVNILLRKGFELVEVKPGKLYNAHYFIATEELYLEIESYLHEVESMLY